MGKSGVLKRGIPGNEIKRQLEQERKKCPRATVPSKYLGEDSVDHCANWNAKNNRRKMPSCDGIPLCVLHKMPRIYLLQQR